MIPKVKFRIYSGFYNDFLNCICENNIPVFNIQSEQLGVVAVCYASDYMKICRLRKRFQTKIKIISKTGIWFKIKYLFKRKGIFAGSLVFLALMYCFSLVIWDINIDVEDIALKNEIVCQLFNQGIYPGIIYSEEKLNNAESFILSANNKIRYISLNFYKGVLDCKISGNVPKEEYLSGLKNENIYAQISGVVSDIRVYDGYSKVELGQSVTSGDLLVSSVFTDKHGNQYTSKTRAYIEAICDKSYSIEIPFDKNVQILTGKSHIEKILYFLDNEINVSIGTNHSFENSLEKTELEYLTIMGFHLPALIKNVYHYEVENIHLKTDSLTARKIAQLQLEHLISADEKLKQEINRQYEYEITHTGLIVHCHINGYYEIT